MSSAMQLQDNDEGIKLAISEPSHFHLLKIII